MAISKHKAALIKQLLEALAADDSDADVELEEEAQRFEPRNSFTLKEIAQRNGFSVPYIYAELHRGNLQAYRPGGTGRMRVTPKQEAEWLARKEAPVPVAPKKATGKKKPANALRKSTPQRAARPRET